MDSSPAPIRRWIHWCDGLNRRVCPAMQTRPVSRCTRSTCCASGQLSASGISTWTCLPARIAAMACRACSWVGVHEDDGVDVVAGEYLVQVGRGMFHAVLPRDLLGLLQPAADHGRDGDAVDEGQPVEVLDAEGAGPGDCDPHG